MRISERIEAAKGVLESLAAEEAVVGEIAGVIVDSLRGGGKLLACGNGGSASESSHLVTELVGRYKASRRGLPAVSLTADGSLLTCVGNDFDFASVFARQVEALGDPGDVLVAFSTSGTSRNVARAIEVGRRQGLTTIALLGRGGGTIRGLAHFELIVGHDETARVQEAHLFLIHTLMDAVEEAVAPAAVSGE